MLVFEERENPRVSGKKTLKPFKHISNKIRVRFTGVHWYSWKLAPEILRQQQRYNICLTAWNEPLTAFEQQYINTWARQQPNEL